MVETEFFKSGDVTVTSARFIVGNKVFAMSGITSIDTQTVNPKRFGPVTCIIIGILMMLGGFNTLAEDGVTSLLIGFVLGAFGFFWYKGQQPELFIFLRTASGEFKALSSTDAEYIYKIIAALNKAIIHRS